MKLDLGGQPWPSKKLSEASLSKYEEPLELCTHLRVRRAEIKQVTLPEQGGLLGKRGAPKHRLHRVQTLELDYNEIESIDGTTFIFPDLEQLDLSYNKIHTISNAEVFLGRLRVLVLKKNRLQHLRWLQGNYGEPLLLQHLDVSANQLSTISDCAELVTLEDLGSVDLTGNPLEGDLTLEAFCMLASPNLTRLNGQVVTETARHRALRWCEESDPGFQVSEYVSELQAYYSKHGRRSESHSVKKPTSPPADVRDAFKGVRNFPWQERPSPSPSPTGSRNKLSLGSNTSPRSRQDPSYGSTQKKQTYPASKAIETVRDPYGYIKQAEVALEHLGNAARSRGYVQQSRCLHSVMSLNELRDRRGRVGKLIPWATWSVEMRRLARRVHEMRATAAPQG